MSWIEQPAQDQVGSFDLTVLDIDKAYLNVSSSVRNVKLWLYQLSSVCIRCPYKLEREVSAEGLQLTMSTLFPVKYRLRTDSVETLVAEDNDPFKFCDVDHGFAEFGVYNLQASGTPDSPTCELTVAAEPVNIYFPLLLALFFYIALFGLVKLIRLFGSRLNKKRETREADLRQASPTSSSAILPPQAGVSTKSDSHKAENGEAGRSGQKGGAAGKDSPRPLTQVTSSQSSTAASPAKRQRLKSLDTFRGLCIVIMIFVNDGGAHYYFFEHAPWDGLYVADLVFPWFLWIMGVAVPIAIKSQVKRGTPRLQIFKAIAIRSVKLIGLGLMHNSHYGPINFGEKANLRIPGVLQRFGICYFVCATLVLVSMTVNFTKPEASKLKAALQDIGILWVSWILVLVIVMIHCLITFLLKVPNCPTGYLGPGGLHDNNSVDKSCIGGASGYVDLKIFTYKHLYQSATAKEIYDSDTYDPEGFLGILTSILQVWLGVQTGATMLVFPRASSRLKRWGIWAVVTGAAGALLCQAKETDGWIPINKNLWSLSFVLVTSSFALILLSTMYVIIDIKHWWDGSPFFEPGMNSILLYVGHSTFDTALPWNWSDGFMRTHFVRLAESLWGTSLWVLIAIRLHMQKTYWSV